MGSEWYYRVAGCASEYGPLSWDGLCSLARSGEVSSEDLVRGPGHEQWSNAADVPGLFQLAATPGGRGPYPGMGPSAAQAPVSSAAWYPWVGALVALAIIGAGLGVFFGFLRGGDGSGLSVSAGLVTETSNLATTATTTPASTTTTTKATILAPAVWSDAAPQGSAPSARRGHGMAYDPTSGKVVLFGGWDGSSVLNDTWTYDPVGNTWTEAAPAGTVPSARQACTMVYDESAGKMLLFGGWDLSAGLNDTWEYDPVANTWTELAPAGSTPSARWGYSMAYDSGTKQTVMFGGYDGTACLGDTWSYDRLTNTWAGGTDAGSPPARRSHAMAYDPDPGWVLTFAGWDGLASRSGCAT